MQKIKIVVRLPHNRDYAGRLHVENADGKRLAGPFPVCGRANDLMARDAKNPGRDPLLPFGDMPLGGYQVQRIIESGTGTAYPGDEFGSSGIVLLQPASGDAGLADANGRFGFFIQGGALSRDRRLRPTEGSLRLTNRDQRKLMGLLRNCECIECDCHVMDAGLARKGRRVADVPAASILAQGKKLLAGMLGAASLEPAHRALLKKMLLAGRITISIPSLLMMSMPTLTQHASAGQEARTLLASRDTLSFPIMLAQADTGVANQDYVGNTEAGKQAQNIDEHGKAAVNAQTPEDAKNESNQGFDTGGGQGGGGQGTGGGAETPPVNVLNEQNQNENGSQTENENKTDANNENAENNNNQNTTQVRSSNRYIPIPVPIPIPLHSQSQQVPPVVDQTPYTSPMPLQSERYNLDHIQVPPPIPPQAAIIGFGQKLEDPQSELVLKGADYGIAVAKTFGKIAGQKIPDVTIILIAGKTFIDAENGADVYLTKHNEVYDQALAYLKDPKMRDQFAHLVVAVRNHQPISEDTPVDMLRAAQAIAESPDTQTSRIVWDSMMSQDARQAALNRLMIESRDFVFGQVMDKGLEASFSSQLGEASVEARQQDYDEAADFLEKAKVVLPQTTDAAARDSLQKGVTLANQIMAKTFATAGARTLGEEFTKGLIKDTIFDSTDQNPEQ